jgi:hypothetical protein
MLVLRFISSASAWLASRAKSDIIPAILAIVAGFDSDRQVNAEQVRRRAGSAKQTSQDADGARDEQYDNAHEINIGINQTFA